MQTARAECLSLGVSASRPAADAPSPSEASFFFSSHLNLTTLYFCGVVALPYFYVSVYGLMKEKNVCNDDEVKRRRMYVMMVW